jgi:hypothetical protein
VIRGRLRIGAQAAAEPVELEVQPLFHQLVIVQGMRAAAEARDHAARLEVRVARLTEELRARGGSGWAARAPSRPTSA